MTDLGASGSGGGRPYELVRDACGLVARISGRGAVVLATPAVNRGTAFTHQERRDLGLLGLLPARVSTVEEQIRRTYEQYSAQPSDLRKWVYLATLREHPKLSRYLEWVRKQK